MRQSEFYYAAREEFGDVYSGVLIRDHWLTALNGTAEQAIEQGVPVRDVWMALCEELQVPSHRRHGRGLRDPRES